MLVAVVAYCIVLGAIAATAVAATKGKSEARKRNISANGQAKVQQQGAGTSERAPLKDRAQAAREPAKQGAKAKGSVFAFLAAAVLVLVAAAGGITWFIAERPAEKTGWQPPSCTPPTAGMLIQKYMDMRDFTYPIATASGKAQRLFDIGLLQAWNFNQPEALRAFKMAAEADPNAAMPYFGEAYALGPGANRDVTTERKPYPSFAPEDFPAVYEASQKALQLASLAQAKAPESQAAKKELAMAIALSGKRFPEGSATGDRRHSAEKEYAEAMARIGGSLNDAAIMAMAAEAFMNLSPWDYYEEGNELKETASMAEELINRALAADPKNPLALHLHIHIAEASSPQRGPHLNAARAEASAQIMLTKNGPWMHGFGHLQHMPSHTFVRLGQWHNAVVSNVNAYNSDLQDGAACMSPYEPEHNTDMLIYAANMAGEFKVAEQFSQLIRQYPTAIPTAYSGDYGADWTHLILTYVIQGEWEAIMELPGQGPPPGARALCPDGGYDYAVTVYHYARTLALAAKAAGIAASGDTGDFYDAYVKGAVISLTKLQAAEAKVKQEERTVPGEDPGIYACDYKKLAQIHSKVAQGRVALLQGDFAGAQAVLEAAHEMEIDMGYMEPPRLYQPVKHCLGYVLQQAGNHQRAAEVYVESMMDTPNSGFALYGLVQSLKSLNRAADAGQIEIVYKEAWGQADAPLASSCPSFSRLAKPDVGRHRRMLS